MIPTRVRFRHPITQVSPAAPADRALTPAQRPSRRRPDPPSRPATRVSEPRARGPPQTERGHTPLPPGLEWFDQLATRALYAAPDRAAHAPRENGGSTPAPRHPRQGLIA